MFDVVIDPDVLERLASRLELWAGELTNEEWAHLVALLGLGSTAVVEAVGGIDSATAWTAGTDAASMGSPGFADALSPAADAVLLRTATGGSVVIASGAAANRWVVTS